MSKTVVRVVAGVLGLAALVLGAATPADAHARLLSATPAPGSTLAIAPSEVRLTFDGPPFSFGIGVVVTSAAGDHLESGRVRIDGNAVVQSLTALTAPGTYSVSWRVVSADGHPVSGEYTFAFAPEGAVVPAQPTSDAPGSDGGAHGWLLLAGAVGAVLGLAALLMLPGRRRRRRRHGAPVTLPGDLS